MDLTVALAAALVTCLNFRCHRVHTPCRANVLPYLQRCTERLQHISAVGRFVKAAAVDSSDWDREAQVELLSRLERKLAEYTTGKRFCFLGKGKE
jgi:hypothetical protein